jgi:pimeloyl-ACP methyl ester carboxylesterase
VIKIPFCDFGGDGPVLHFAHANGYPPGVYRRFIEPFLSEFRVLAAKHRPLWTEMPPPGEVKSWHVIAEDLIHFLDQQDVSDVIGVGHSLGANATILAALRRSDLFRVLVLIEPILLPFIFGFFLRIAPRPLAMKVPLMRKTLNRTDTWATPQVAFDYVRSRQIFDSVSDEVLWDYVSHGMRVNQEGSTSLVYPKEWEAYIYSRAPLAWRELEQLSKPTLGVRGVDSIYLTQGVWQRWRQTQPEATFTEVANSGHLVPLESPAELARSVLHYLQSEHASDR